MSELPQRKSPRLQGYDYSQSGTYFVTICTHKRYFHFGDILGDMMKYSLLGLSAIKFWKSIPEHYKSIELDYFVVMPNHIHGILVLEDNSPKLGIIIGTYKAAVTRTARQNGIFHKIWQSSYHDHIVRNEKSLNYIRQYVLYNPEKWAEDKYYSENNGMK